MSVQNMKVRIDYTINVGDDYRRAIRNYHGKEGLATRQEIKDWFEIYGQTMDQDVMVQLEIDNPSAESA